MLESSVPLGQSYFAHSVCRRSKTEFAIDVFGYNLVPYPYLTYMWQYEVSNQVMSSNRRSVQIHSCHGGWSYQLLHRGQYVCNKYVLNAQAQWHYHWSSNIVHASQNLITLCNMHAVSTDCLRNILFNCCVVWSPHNVRILKWLSRYDASPKN